MRTPRRRTVLSAAGLALGGTFVGDAVTAADGSPSFTSVQSEQLQYDGAKTGHTDASAPSTALGPAWRFQRPGASGCASAPAIADGTLYFVSNTAERNGIVHAVDADGTELWRTETSVAQCSPAIADGLVFVGGRPAGLLALDAATGERQWSVGDGTRSEASPTVANGTVFLPGVTQSGQVTARNTADGAEQWSIQTSIPGSATSMTGVAVADGTAYFAVGTDAGVGELYAVDAGTGKRQWGAGFPRAGRYTGNIATPAVAGDRVFFATNNALFAFSLDGAEQWRTTIDGFTPRYFTEQSPAVADGTVYFPDGDGLSAVDAASGERTWTFEAPDVTVSSSASVADDTVYVGTERAGVYALDAATGDPVGQYRSSGDVRVVVQPVAVDGRVYVGEFSDADDADPTLVALESGDTAAEDTYEGPIARIATEPPDAGERTVESGATVVLDASGSATGTSDIASYEWTVNGYDTHTGPETTVELDGVCGDWRVTLTVTDERGVSDETDIVLHVGD